MKTFLVTIVLTVIITGIMKSQSIPDVNFETEGKNINIFYDLFGDNTTTYFIEVFCSENDGQTYGLALKSVTGDVGTGIKAGYNKKITWNVLADREEITGNFKFKVDFTEELQTIKLDSYVLGIPDVFTPDGGNTQFKPDISKWQGINKHKMSILNKSGDKIWESESFPTGWDGKQNGKYVPAGTYFWILELFLGAQNSRQIIKGELIIFSPGNKTKAKPAEVKETPNEFTDTRDGKTYKWVKIGNQTWMAENLNYNSSGASWCYNEKEVNCETYGMLYDWESAKTACPDGWHLPSEDEWDVLIDFLGGKKIAGGKMKESGYEHWSSPNLGAANTFGFDGLPGGWKEINNSHSFSTFPGTSRNQTEKYTKQTKGSFFWTSDKSAGSGARFISLKFDEEKVYHSSCERMSGISIRCIKN